MSKGIRVKGTQLRYWDKYGNPQLPSHVSLCEIELPPVRPEELRSGRKALAIITLTSEDGNLTWDWGNDVTDFRKSIVSILPEEPGAKIPEVKEEKSCEKCDFFYPTYGAPQISHCHNGHKCEDFSLYHPKQSPQPKEEQPIPACHPDLHLPLEANIIGYARCSKCGNLYKPEGELDFGDLKIHESPSGAFCESEMSRWEKHNKLVDLMESLYKRK